MSSQKQTEKATSRAKVTLAIPDGQVVSRTSPATKTKSPRSDKVSFTDIANIIEDHAAVHGGPALQVLESLRNTNKSYGQRFNRAYTDFMRTQETNFYSPLSTKNLIDFIQRVHDAQDINARMVKKAGFDACHFEERIHAHRHWVDIYFVNYKPYHVYHIHFDANSHYKDLFCSTIYQYPEPASRTVLNKNDAKQEFKNMERYGEFAPSHHHKKNSLQIKVQFHFNLKPEECGLSCTRIAGKTTWNKTVTHIQQPVIANITYQIATSWGVMSPVDGAYGDWTAHDMESIYLPSLVESRHILKSFPLKKMEGSRKVMLNLKYKYNRKGNEKNKEAKALYKKNAPLITEFLNVKGLRVEYIQMNRQTWEGDTFQIYHYA